MFYFLLSVTFTVALYLILRSYPRYSINSFHAIIFNYLACIGTGLLLFPDPNRFSSVDWGAPPTLFTLALGTLFIIVFTTIGTTSQRVSVSAASLASNMSLIIPVVFGLFIFKNTNKPFTNFNYLGLMLALAALGLGSIQSGPDNKEEKASTDNKHWLWTLPVSTFLLAGTNNTLINYLTMRYYTPGQTTLFMIIACGGASTIGLVILIYKILVHKETVNLASVIGGVILGIPNFLSLYFLLKALNEFGNSAAFVFPVYNILTMLVSALAARILFKEQTSTLNRIGLGLAVLAIFLISYQELGWD